MTLFIKNQETVSSTKKGDPLILIYTTLHSLSLRLCACVCVCVQLLQKIYWIFSRGFRSCNGC